MGDNLLKTIRDYILGLYIPDLTPYRISGDDFCLTMEHGSEEDIMRIDTAILHRTQEPWIFGNSGSKLYIYTNAYVGVILSKFVNNDEQPYL